MKESLMLLEDHDIIIIIIATIMIKDWEILF